MSMSWSQLAWTCFYKWLMYEHKYNTQLIKSDSKIAAEMK